MKPMQGIRLWINPIRVFQVGLIGYLVVYQAAGQHLSGTLEAGAMHQAVRWNKISKPDL
jgi:hypothetical protein